MAIHLITGGSGQGKTEYLVDQAIRESIENKDRSYYVIVPEQFSLEMQKKMIACHPRHGFINIDVLSFHRLAWRIFEEAGFQPPDILEDLGVSMMLRKILSQKQDDLLFFKKSASKPGFVDEVRSALMELSCFGIEWQDLEKAAGMVESRGSLALKCRDLSKLYRYFNEETEGRYMVSEQILTVAGEWLARSSLVRDAVFYFDGFTGFTPVQEDFLRQLALQASKITVTVTTPEKLPSHEENLFSLSSRTIRSLMEISRQTGVPWGDSVHLDHPIPPRFVNAPDIAVIERSLYQPARAGTASLASETDGANIHMVSCRNPGAEAEFVLHKIEELVRKEGYRYRDCAVLSADVNVYMQEFSRQAGILGIPLFEDVKRRLSYHSGMEGIRALFHLAESDYSYESVFRYLKSGMSAFTDLETDFLENYVLLSGIRGYSSWKKPFRRRLSSYSETDRKKLEELRVRLLDETEEFCRSLIRKDLTAGQKMQTLTQMMDRLSWPDRLLSMAARKEEEGDLSRAKEYEQLFPLIQELIGKISLVFGEEFISLETLSDVMDTGLESLGLGLPPLSMDQVILGDLKRTRLPEVKALFILGFNEGMIPPIVEERGMFNDEDKEVLAKVGIELSSNRYEKTLEDEFYTYLAFTRPSASLWFTMSATDNAGKALRPSPLVKKLESFFSGIRILSYPGEEGRLYFNEADSLEFLAERMRRLKENPERGSRDRSLRALAGYWAGENDGARLKSFWEKIYTRHHKKIISSSYLDAFYGKELSGSVTRLEQYASCPFAFFVIFGLGLKEREEFEIKPNELGSLFHNVLEKYAERVRKEGLRWKNVPEDLRRDFLDEALREAAETDLHDYFESSARSRYTLERARRILSRTVDIITRQLMHSDFEPDRFEMRFGKKDGLTSAVIPLSQGRVMNLTGIVDRVDICMDQDRILLRVIDYKSGENKLDLDNLYHGLSLQLALYMNAAREIYEKDREESVIPAGLFYYHMQDPLVEADYMNDEKYLKEFQMQGYANADPEIIRKMEDPPNPCFTMPVTITKKGIPDKRSAVLTTEDFRDIREYVQKLIAGIGRRIFSGDVSPVPYVKGDRSACRYCPAWDICGLDPREDQECWRRINGMGKDEVLAAIRREIGAESDDGDKDADRTGTGPVPESLSYDRDKEDA